MKHLTEVAWASFADSTAESKPGWDQGRTWWPVRDVDRPHVRLGLGWFVVVVAALLVGPPAVATVYGIVAGVAGLQIARAWQRVGESPEFALSGLLAVALPFAALVSWGVGLVMLVGTAISVLVAKAPLERVIVDGGFTIRSWLFAGVAAASPVVAFEIDRGAAVALVILASAYEAGDYLFGADARWPVVGPVAGLVTVGVFSFSFFVLAWSPFDGAGLFLYAIVLAVLAPVGQIAGSLVLPDGQALANGLRRLDTLLVAGPVWIVLLHAGVGVSI